MNTQTGKCPKCDKAIRGLKISHMNATTGVPGISGGYHAMTLECPSCHAIVGAQLDPIAIQEDTARRVYELMTGKKYKAGAR